jgi:hypothetical protein
MCACPSQTLLQSVDYHSNAYLDHYDLERLQSTLRLARDVAYKKVGCPATIKAPLLHAAPGASACIIRGHHQYDPP